MNSKSLASGISVNFGTMTKPLHAGHAARNGVMAALLGKRGFTANHAALEGPAGYFSTFQTPVISGRASPLNVSSLTLCPVFVGSTSALRFPFVH